MTDALDIKGIADKLQVTYWRARRWRKNFLTGTAGRALPAPDVMDSPPRWSHRAIELWAAGETLWPPAVDQYHCSACDFTGCVYSEVDLKMRDHGMTFDPEQQVWVCCPGSGEPAKGRVLAGAV